MPDRPGFTLIELLVTLAILLILIAIALPNFLEAQIRARVVRTRSELKTISAALLRYHQDFHFYPLRTTPNGQTWPSGLNNLTTPIRYMDPARLPDPFPDEPYYILYRYWPIRADGYIQDNNSPSNRDSSWYLLSSNGPDQDFNAFAETLRGQGSFLDVVYAPTNGSRSSGNIWRQGGQAEGRARANVVPCLPGSDRD